MIIGIDASRAVDGKRTGTEAYSHFLIGSLVQLAADRGHSVRLYFNGRPARDTFPASELVELVDLRFPRLWTHLRLAAELHRRPPHVFYTPAHVIPISYKGNSVATVHDLGFYYYPRAHTRTQSFYLRWSTSHNSRRSRMLIADSMVTRDDLVKFCDVPAARVTVVYPGIDPNLGPVTDKERLSSVREKYGISAPYIITIGTLHPRKNLVRLIDSFLNSKVDHQLVLAGKAGWLSEPIMERLQRLDPLERERILLPGYVDAEDKGALLSGSDALVFPSLYEGFGFPLIEGNVCATPVLAANSSSLPEIANGAALLVDPLDESALTEGIRQILGDEPLRHSLIEAGIGNARRFSWSVAAEKTLEVLETAAA